MLSERVLRIISYLVLLLGVLWIPGEAQSSPPNFQYEVLSHYLTVQIDPATHLIKAEDRLSIKVKEKKDQTISLLLHPGLKVLKITDLKAGKPVNWSETLFSAQAKRVDLSLKAPENPVSLSFGYEGEIYDPVIKERELQFVRGDRTSGIISPEGIYLSNPAHWFPDRPDSTSKFEVEISIPEPYRVVTQGELRLEEKRAGTWHSHWISEKPTEGLALVGGKYSVKRRAVDGIKISTYFFPEDERFSDIFLNATEEYLKTYSELLGPYPYKKFDTVQNFFASGYSFPTFTLLAAEAIRHGKEFLRPGTLDHEIVHSWWGHDVGVKPGTGNWVEALTTYCTNYYFKELKIGEEAARKHRQDQIQKYAVRVSPSEEYPLQKFVAKQDDRDGEIGYGKGSMVFHMLRRIVGKDLFFAGLKTFYERFAGKPASWRDIEQTFEEVGGKKLDGFFDQWLERPGGPRLKLEKTGYRITSKGYLVSGEVVQEGEEYELHLPIKIDDGAAGWNFILNLSKERTPFSIEIPKLPLSISLDPNYHLFRRLYPEEIMPCLNAFLENNDLSPPPPPIQGEGKRREVPGLQEGKRRGEVGEKIFVVPDEGQEDEKSRKIYVELAKMAKERKGGEIFSVKELKEEKVLNSSLMLLGESWRSPIFSKVLKSLPKPIQVEKGSFLIDGKKVEEERSVLLTYPHPFHPGGWVTIYFGATEAALSRARYIFFYGWDSYILFKKGRPEERGHFPPARSFSSYDFQQKDLIDPRGLKDHISYLSSAERGGRFPGTPEYEKAQRYLIKRLEEIGITPMVQPFTTTVRDIEKLSLIVKTIRGEEKLKAIPLQFSKGGEWYGPVAFVDEKEIEKSKELPASFLMIRPKLPDKSPEDHLYRSIRNLQSKGARGLFIFLREEELNGFTPYITYPSKFPPKIEKRLKEKEEGDCLIQPLIEATRIVSRVKDLSFRIDLPVLIIPYSTGEEEWVENLSNQKELSFDLVLSFKDYHVKDANIGGIIQGSDPEKKSEFLVLGAHYDHLGKNGKSGRCCPGADDNASGVSALLEIGRSLMAKRADLKRSVIVLFFGGEEWGLRGSRKFVSDPFVPLAQMKAMFSIDSIGGITKEREVFFVGGSVYPSLSQRSRRFLQRLELKEGKDIDARAFHYGSDHFPFHLKGIPALDYFSSEFKKLHTFRDNVEAIDFDKLRDVTRLIYLTAYEFLTEP